MLFLVGVVKAVKPGINVLCCIFCVIVSLCFC